MSDNAEAGIAKTQAAAARGDGLPEYQKKTIAYLDERILIYLLAIAFVGVILVWAMATSPLVQYGSLAVVIVLTILWGIARQNQIERTRQKRAREADNWQSGKPE